MDYYLNPKNSTDRLLKEYDEHGSLVVAFDFDDTVYDFHNKGRSYQNVITLLQKLKAINCYIVCWTGNEDQQLVSTYLTQHQIPFDAINENPPFYKTESRKIYANAYLDDRAGLKQVFDELNEVLLFTEKTKKI